MQLTKLVTPMENQGVQVHISIGTGATFLVHFTMLAPYLILTLKVLGHTSFRDPGGVFSNVSFMNLHENFGLLFSPSTKSCNLSQGMTAKSINLCWPPPCVRRGFHNMSSFLNGPGGGFYNIPLISSKSTRSLSGSYKGSLGSSFASTMGSTYI
jgi:hypothetical protein